MTDDELRARLAAVIPTGNIWWTQDDIAEALLPLVREIEDEAWARGYLAGEAR